VKNGAKSPPRSRNGPIGAVLIRLCFFLLLSGGILEGRSWGQRIRFPSRIPETPLSVNDPAAASRGVTAGVRAEPGSAQAGRAGIVPPPNGATSRASGGVGTLANPAPAPGSSPGAFGGTVSSGLGNSPNLGAPFPPSSPGGPPGIGLPQGAGQSTLPPNWDPFGPAGADPPPTLLPKDPLVPGVSRESWSSVQRFLQEIRLDNVWMPGDSASELGLNDTELSATFAIPLGWDIEHPLLITPGFAAQFWTGPEGPPQELPPRTFEAYLQGAWLPQVTEIVGAELAVRIGVYSDLSAVVEESIRIHGRGLGVIALSPGIRLKLGVWYLDRNDVKMLPAGGLVWTPSADIQLDAVFPNPRLAIRFPGYRSTDWWIYLRGEYGGDSWTAELDAPGHTPHPYEVDYNDLRLGLGVEFKTVRGFSGLVEVGGAFGRELLYFEPIGQAPIPPFRPDPVVYIRGGLAY